MKVYIVYEDVMMCDYSAPVAVFKSKEKAEALAQKLSNNPQVEEWELL